MSITRFTTCVGLGLGLLSLPGCDSEVEDVEAEVEFRSGWNHAPEFNTGSYNVHLERTVRFEHAAPGSDAAAGQALFGVAADGINPDPSGGLFQGDSMVFGGEVTSNGRTCFTCHRGPDVDWGMPVPPFSDSVPPDDPLFTGLDADAQGDPDGEFNLDELGLFKIRPNRFNVTRDADDPFRQVFGWRKSPAISDIGLAHGLLTDLRARTMFELARGAVFSHTQISDARFDDLFSQADGDNLGAFMLGLHTDPALAALRDPSDPGHQALIDDPFATVPVTTRRQRKGRRLFKKHCMACHNTPNVFNNLDNIEPVGNGERPTSFPPMAPAIGRGFNVGVAEANMHGLRFTHDNGDGSFSPIIIPLAEEDGTLVEHEIEFDIGLAATTGRVEDIGRFKVPSLRNVGNHAPYFHDNSVDTLEEVVDYFCSDEYNNSPAGQRYPIHMNANKRAKLVEFLELL
ncbi:MAG: hypothetical protein AAF799_23790 [Myxococcota bacterium]